MRDAPDAITAFLGRVRAVSRRRRALRWSLDFLLGFAALSAVAVAVTALTSRGDVWGPVGLAALLGAAVGTTYWSVRRRSREDARLLSAREVAGHRGPLAVPPLTPNDDAFRAEILGATELLVSAGGDDARGSSQLSALYVERIGRRLMEAEPRRAVPGVAWRPRMMSAVVLSATWLALLTTPDTAAAFSALLAFEDARPPLPPEPIWSRLELVLEYPTHTGRPSRRVPNPSGALRVPAGTQVKVEFWTQRSEAAARLAVQTQGVDAVNTPDPQLVEMRSDATADAGQRHWEGEFEVVGATTWHALVFEEAGDDEPTARSLELAFELERDAEPEVELEPLPDGAKEASELQTVSLRFTARDDFGLRSAELAYSLSDGTVHRLPAGEPAGDLRRWNHRYDWDLSAIPTDERGLLTYWIEVRDNDPGLGLEPLVDGPGKIAASARQQLLVHDEEAEHAANLRDLQAIRDAAVDLLAARLTTAAFAELDVEPRLGAKLQTARDLHTGSATLLTMLAASVDALAVDTMIAERDVETLAGIHARLLELHRGEAKIHEDLPPGAEVERPEDRAPLLRELGRHNRDEITQLEDEIIRLDDLVDAQIIARIEALVARLQVSQQKLVEKLEQLQAGDESVRPEIEQLEQRIREDMRKVQEAQAQLRKEVGDEFMNLDAFKAMEARMRSQELLEQLRQGDVQGALDQAREGLDAIRQLREQVQRSGAEQPGPALSEEDRKRMKLLRELSRIQDDETGLRGETKRLREQWRSAVGDREAEAEAVEGAGERAKQLREGAEALNDAHLSREGRQAWDDAREALEALEAAAADGQASELELFEAANEAAAALRRAEAGAETGEAEAKALKKLAGEAERVRDRLREPIPDPDEVLDRGDVERLAELGRKQATLRERTKQLLADPAADILPAPGRQAMDAAGRAMGEASESLDDASLEPALRGEDQAWQGIQRAIDSLRQSSPPPPRSSEGDASTEAERDRSLRDQVVEAMREGDRDDFDADTKRYYEELLR